MTDYLLTLVRRARDERSGGAVRPAPRVRFAPQVPVEREEEEGAPASEPTGAAESVESRRRAPRRCGLEAADARPSSRESLLEPAAAPDAPARPEGEPATVSAGGICEQPPQPPVLETRAALLPASEARPASAPSRAQQRRPSEPAHAPQALSVAPAPRPEPPQLARPAADPAWPRPRPHSVPAREPRPPPAAPTPRQVAVRPEPVRPTRARPVPASVPRSAPQVEPVRVTIGRVEVRAVAAPAPAAPPARRPADARPGLSLQDYLSRREAGR
jgi:hypothetical protein